MHTRFPIQSIVSAVFIAAQLLLSASSCDAADLLDTPAKHSPSARRVVMTAVVPAGSALVGVGDRGIIFRSDDGGKSWVQGDVPVSVMLTGAYFVDERFGWVVGHDGVVLASSDGGKTWRKQFDGNQANRMVLDAAQAQVRRASAVVASASGAALDLAKQALEKAQFALDDGKAGAAFGPSRPLLNVWFRNATQGYIVGSYGQIFRTRDGGAKWEYIGDRLNNPDKLHLNAIVGSASGVLLVAGESGSVYRSDDAGDSWVRYDTLYNGALYGVLSLDAPDGAAQGILAYGFGGRAFRLLKGGAKWEQLSMGVKTPIVAGVRSGSAIYLLVQDGAILQCDDAVQSCSPVSPASATRASGFAPIKGADGFVIAGIGGLRSVYFKVPSK